MLSLDDIARIERLAERVPCFRVYNNQELELQRFDKHLFINVEGKRGFEVKVKRWQP
jgi:hypothetical protein